MFDFRYNDSNDPIFDTPLATKLHSSRREILVAEDSFKVKLLTLKMSEDSKETKYIQGEQAGMGSDEGGDSFVTTDGIEDDPIEEVNIVAFSMELNESKGSIEEKSSRTSEQSRSTPLDKRKGLLVEDEI